MARLTGMRPFSASLLLLLLGSPLLSASDLTATSARVEAIRQQKFTSPVVSASADRAALREMISNEIARDAGSAAAYRRTLESMLLVERDERMIEKLLEAYEAQVLAWYSPEEGKFFVLSDPVAEVPELPMFREMIEVHELTHALQDQRFGAGDRLRSLATDWDRAQAYHAVLEGEASLVMLESMLQGMGLSLETAREGGLDLDQLSSAMEGASASGFAADVPGYFVESMKFPYMEGLKFVLDIWSGEGWKGLDRVHANPPLTTEEILDPELYRARIASGKAPASRSFSSAAESFSTSLGEFHWRFLLGREAADGVDQGTFRLSPAEGGNWIAEVDTRWDSERDAEEFSAAYRELLVSRSIEPQIQRKGRRVSVTYPWSDEEVAP